MAISFGVASRCRRIQQHWPEAVRLTGKELNTAVAHVWTLRKGKAVRCQSYQEPAKWLEALGETQSPEQRLAA